VLDPDELCVQREQNALDVGASEVESAVADGRGE
jgi:hypothetical protein